MSEVAEYHWADQDNLPEGDGNSESHDIPRTIAQNEQDHQEQRKRIHFLQDAARQESDDSVKALVLKNRPVLSSGNSFNEVYAQFALTVETADEQIDDFAGDFFELYQKYKIALAYPDLTQNIAVSDELLHRLIPQNQTLRQAVAESLKGKEEVSVKELLATCIFQEIIGKKTDQINERLASLGSTETEPKDRNEKLQTALENLGIRTPTDSPKPLAVAELLKLNQQLRAIPKSEVRQVLLNQFVKEVSAAVGMKTDDFSTRLHFEMRQVQGVETLKTTFVTLQADGKLAKVMNDDGSLNSEVFQHYFLAASETVVEDFKIFESTIEPSESKPKTPEPNKLKPLYGEIQLAEIEHNPVLSRLAKVNPLIADLFFKDGHISTIPLPNDHIGYEFRIDDQAREYNLILRLDPTTGKAAIFVDDVLAMPTPVTHEIELRRNLNTAVANRVVLHDLKLPRSCFMPDSVDEKELEGLNDPLQLLTEILPENEFPQDTVLNLNGETVGRLRETLELKLGEEYRHAANAAEVGRLLEKQGWLDEKGQLQLSANRELQVTYAQIKRDPSLDSPDELRAA